MRNRDKDAGSAEQEGRTGQRAPGAQPDDEGGSKSLCLRKGPLPEVELHDAAEKMIQAVCDELLPEGAGPVLELLAGSQSLFPKTFPKNGIFGIGNYAEELRNNPVFSHRVVLDLNAEPSLPFRDNVFNASVLFFGVETLHHPAEVFTEVARVLKPGAVFVVAFSPVTNPVQSIPQWKTWTDQEKLSAVVSSFEAAEPFGRVTALGTRKKHRNEPGRKRFPIKKKAPVWIVYSCKRPEESPSDHPWGCLPRHEASGSDPYICPYCGDRLKKWEVPHSPFEIDCWYETDYLYICFNDECPYFKRGWEWMWSKMRRNVSYRHMYNPVTRGSSPMPVPTSFALKDGIVEDRDPIQGADGSIR